METKIHTGDPAESIEMSFNLGVSLKQQQGAMLVGEATQVLGELIFNNMRAAHQGATDETVITNADYYLQIALLGFILPGIAYPDTEFKQALFSSLIKRLASFNPPHAQATG